MASKSLEEELRICFDPIENRASILEVNADGPEGLIFLEHCALTVLYCFSMAQKPAGCQANLLINVKQCKFTFACVSHTFATVPRHFC